MNPLEVSGLRVELGIGRIQDSADEVASLDEERVVVTDEELDRSLGQRRDIEFGGRAGTE